MKLTLQGLLRALRMKAHAVAEEIEAGYARGELPVLNPRMARQDLEVRDDVRRS
jgi:hypothetical protein